MIVIYATKLIVRQVSDLCLGIINVLKFIMGWKAGFRDVLSVLILGIHIGSY